MKNQSVICLMAIAVLLSACGVSSIEVQGSYPRPAVQALPLTIGVYYDQALLDFEYIEYSETGREEYRITSGQTHMDLFNTVLPAMFENVVQVNSPRAPANSGIDAVFVPGIDEFQLGLPRKTRLDAYEVWIQYNMRLISPEGEAIADWVLTAYGKTSDNGIGSGDAGIRDATVAALRDLGTNFALTFSSVPDVRDWLQAQGQQ